MSNKRCFVCDHRAVLSDRVYMASSASSHSKISYPEMISELIGDEYMVAVTDDDYACKKCGTMFNRMDKLENDLKVVKQTLLCAIENKYMIHLKRDFDAPVEQKSLEELYNEINKVNVGSKASISGAGSSVGTALQHRPASVLPDTATIAPPVVPPPELAKKSAGAEPSTNKLKIYKCGFCSFQSRELATVRTHMKIHMSSKGQTTPSADVNKPPSSSTAEKRRVYRCQVCAASFDDRASCLQHISKIHAASKKEEDPNRPSTSAAAVAAATNVEQTPQSPFKRAKLEFPSVQSKQIVAGAGGLLKNPKENVYKKRTPTFKPVSAVAVTAAVTTADRSINKMNDGSIATAELATGKQDINVGDKAMTQESGIANATVEQEVPTKNVVHKAAAEDEPTEKEITQDHSTTENEKAIEQETNTELETSVKDKVAERNTAIKDKAGVETTKTTTLGNETDTEPAILIEKAGAEHVVMENEDGTQSAIIEKDTDIQQTTLEKEHGIEPLTVENDADVEHATVEKENETVTTTNKEDVSAEHAIIQKEDGAESASGDEANVVFPTTKKENGTEHTDIEKEAHAESTTMKHEGSIEHGTMEQEADAKHTAMEIEADAEDSTATANEPTKVDEESVEEDAAAEQVQPSEMEAAGNPSSIDRLNIDAMIAELNSDGPAVAANTDKNESTAMEINDE